MSAHFTACSLQLSYFLNRSPTREEHFARIGRSAGRVAIVAIFAGSWPFRWSRHLWSHRFKASPDRPRCGDQGRPMGSCLTMELAKKRNARPDRSRPVWLQDGHPQQYDACVAGCLSRRVYWGGMGATRRMTVSLTVVVKARHPDPNWLRQTGGGITAEFSSDWSPFGPSRNRCAVKIRSSRTRKKNHLVWATVMFVSFGVGLGKIHTI